MQALVFHMKLCEKRYWGLLRHFIDSLETSKGRKNKWGVLLKSGKKDFRKKTLKFYEFVFSNNFENISCGTVVFLGFSHEFVWFV